MDVREKIKKILCTIANFLLMIISLYGSLLFKKSIFRVEEIQKGILFNILKKNRNSGFGLKYDFFSIYDIADFKARIPIADYDLYIPYIDSILKENAGILTSEPVLMLEPTSGSTSPSKYIPYTRTLRNEFRKGISPWLFDLFIKREKLLTGTAYWSITPVSTNGSISTGGIPIGFKDDGEYFGSFERYLMNFVFAVPKEVSRIDNITSFYYVTLLFLLNDKSLSFISVWNPTFLTLLLKPTLEWSQALISDIKNGSISSHIEINIELKKRLLKKLFKNTKRAKELESIFERWNKREHLYFDGTSLYKEIWPNLTLISCWTDGNASYYIKELRILFPNVEIQSKGLIATEGFISFPLIGEKGAALSINSHFFEFIEVKPFVNREENSDAHVDIKLAHQLEFGKFYSLIITTGGGLYRYRLYDIIEVVGFKKQCPLVRFVSRENKVSDVFGEKLNEYCVSAILSEVFKKYSILPSFFMIAPEKDMKTAEYFYTLFLELKKDDLKVTFQSLVQEIEERLQENYHYKYCRKLGQLSGLQIFIINSSKMALETYVRACRTFDQKLGNIKPSLLHFRMGWSKEFCGYFVKL